VSFLKHGVALVIPTVAACVDLVVHLAPVEAPSTRNAAAIITTAVEGSQNTMP
jgi:hypothetical protein